MKIENKGDSKMKVILDVPFTSQNIPDVPKNWINRSCGVTCVKMVLDYFFEKDLIYFAGPKNKLSINQLIDEGIQIGSYKENVGWIHSGLVKILRNHGVLSYTQEFKSVNVTIDQIHGVTFVDGKNYPEMPIYGIKKIISSLNSERPVIVSVEPGFSNNKDNHLIVLTGFENINFDNKIDGFIYFHDPDARDGVEKINFKVSLSDFIKKWRKMAIFLD